MISPAISASFNSEYLAARKQLESLYGKTEVERTINQLSGRKAVPQQPIRSFANDTDDKTHGHPS